MPSYDHHALEAHLPHRGVNLIPDVVEISADGLEATSRTRIPVTDNRGRQVFARNDHRWSEPFLAELMALTGVPLLTAKLAPQGQVAVFSMISKIHFTLPAKITEEVIGHAKITRERSGFTTFSTRAEIAGQTILEAEVMSGAAVLSEIACCSARPFHGQLPSSPLPAGCLDWKPPHLRFVDAVVHAEPAERKLVARYTYPDNHPFVPGHFPGAPLMMGVTQWSAVADAAWAAAQLFGIKGDVVANGTVKRQDGSEVLDVRELMLQVTNGIPHISATRRVAFREPVRPTDGLLVEVTVAPAVL
jgi:3-hydroxymyristoyl/3-hydroxydecanoyl-(acyl carrier protein) dehydratase